MLKWMPFTMVRITIYFIAGIVVGIFQPECIRYEVGLTLLLFLTLVYFILFFILRQHPALIITSGLIGLTSLFFAGYLNVINRTDRQPDPSTPAFQNIDCYVGAITGLPEERAQGEKIEIELISIRSNRKWIHFKGKAILYVAVAHSSIDLDHGDKIVVKGALRLVEPPANPGEFDFRKFLSYKNIYYQQFVKRDQIVVIKRNDRPGLLGYSQQMRSWASSIIEHHVAGAREQAITKALVLGVTDGIDNDLQGAYAASGAMHILSVSGLHVGIIYGIILLLLRPLKDQAWSGWLTAIVSLLCLWAYALVTGLSPSVLRAVAMFSFIVVARPFGRQTNIYNTLAASAFLLLIFNPYLIMSVGFQLSYLAVVGIVYLQRTLSDLWEPSSWLAEKIWQVLCVSIAAQLATLAAGLYYFHQFPVYFLISNLIVIPLSSLVLVAGVGLLCASAFPLLANFVGLILQWLIQLLNGIVFFIEDLPFSLVDGVTISSTQCWLLMAMVIFCVLLFEQRKFVFVVIFFLSTFSFVVLQWMNTVGQLNEKQFIIYRVPRHQAIEWIESCHSQFYADTALINDKDQLRFHILPNRVRSGVTKTRVLENDPSQLRRFNGFRLLYHHQQSALWIDKNNCDLPANAVVDYLIIGKDGLRSLSSICKKVKFKVLMLDSSNSRSFTERIVKEAAAENIAVYPVLFKGAFVLNYSL